MKILYGACGTGMGHAMRSAVVAEHLTACGHAVTFASSGAALDYLRQRWPTLPIVGLESVILGNRLLPEATLAVNAARSFLALPAHLLSFLGMAGCVRPDVVITDFEPCSARFAALARLPLLAIDNIHFLNRCTHPREVIETDRAAAALMYPFTENLIPHAQHYLVTTFAYAQTCKPNTTLHLPILRDIILGAKGAPSHDHVVVYFTSKSDQSAADRILHQLPVAFRVYGRRDQATEERVGNVTYCPFSDAAFVHDMATAHCVIGTAGFTFMSESIYLAKPMLALPLLGQFEQTLNANYLAHLGYGERVDELTAKTLDRFLQRVPHYRRRLSRFVHDGNVNLLATVDTALEACA